MQWYNLGGGGSEEGVTSISPAGRGEERRQGVWVGPKPLRSVATRERGREGHTVWGGRGQGDGGGILIYYGRDWLMLMCSLPRSVVIIKAAVLGDDFREYFILLP